MAGQTTDEPVLTSHVRDLADKFPAPFPGAIVGLHHGTLTAELWKAVGYEEMFWHDHPQDEIYVVISGNATFVNERGEIPNCHAGDIVFCPAGLKHTFRNFTDDFVVWIFVYGPRGGEKGRKASTLGEAHA